MRDYQLVSPSLEGVLRHGTVSYEGIDRPEEVLRVLDGPSSKGVEGPAYTEKEQKVLQEYFHDLYGVFMKKLSNFVVDSSVDPSEPIKLQAMLQEMIKIRKLIEKGNTKRSSGK